MTPVPPPVHSPARSSQDTAFPLVTALFRPSVPIPVSRLDADRPGGDAGKPSRLGTFHIKGELQPSWEDSRSIPRPSLSTRTFCANRANTRTTRSSIWTSTSAPGSRKATGSSFRPTSSTGDRRGRAQCHQGGAELLRGIGRRDAGRGRLLREGGHGECRRTRQDLHGWRGDRRQAPGRTQCHEPLRQRSPIPGTSSRRRARRRRSTTDRSRPSRRSTSTRPCRLWSGSSPRNSTTTRILSRKPSRRSPATGRRSPRRRRRARTSPISTSTSTPTSCRSSNSPTTGRETPRT